MPNFILTLAGRASLREEVERRRMKHRHPKGRDTCVKKAYRVGKAALGLLFLGGVLALAVSTGATETPGGERIVLYSYGPGRVLLTDPRGLRCGLDLATGEELREIPGIRLEEERAADRAPGWTITLPNPVPGPYRVLVLGTGKGGVVLDLEAVDGSGRARTSHAFIRVQEGEKTVYLLNYSPRPGSDNVLHEVSP